LREFIADIDAVGLSHVQEEWPDLVVTYEHAKTALSSSADCVVEKEKRASEASRGRSQAKAAFRRLWPIQLVLRKYTIHECLAIRAGWATSTNFMRDFERHVPVIVGARKRCVDKAMRCALSPLLGECTSGEEIIAKTKTLARKWQARLLALREAGWEPGGARDVHFLTDCPPTGVLLHLAQYFPRPCCLRDLCPWCWAREHVAALYQSLEMALYPRLRSRRPADYRILTYHAWSFVPHEALSLAELFAKLATAPVLYRSMTKNRRIAGGYWHVTVEPGVRDRDFTDRSVWNAHYRMLTLCPPDEAEWSPAGLGCASRRAAAHTTESLLESVSVREAW